MARPLNCDLGVSQGFVYRRGLLPLHGADCHAALCLTDAGLAKKYRSWAFRDRLGRIWGANAATATRTVAVAFSEPIVLHELTYMARGRIELPTRRFSESQTHFNPVTACCSKSLTAKRFRQSRVRPGSRTFGLLSPSSSANRAQLGRFRPAIR